MSGVRRTRRTGTRETRASAVSRQTSVARGCRDTPALEPRPPGDCLGEVRLLPKLRVSRACNAPVTLRGRPIGHGRGEAEAPPRCRAGRDRAAGPVPPVGPEPRARPRCWPAGTACGAARGSALRTLPRDAAPSLRDARSGRWVAEFPRPKTVAARRVAAAPARRSSPGGGNPRAARGIAPSLAETPCTRPTDPLAPSVTARPLLNPRLTPSCRGCYRLPPWTPRRGGG